MADIGGAVIERTAILGRKVCNSGLGLNALKIKNKRKTRLEPVWKEDLVCMLAFVKFGWNWLSGCGVPVDQAR